MRVLVPNSAAAVAALSFFIGAADLDPHRRRENNFYFYGYNSCGIVSSRIVVSTRNLDVFRLSPPNRADFLLFPESSVTFNK